MTQVLNVDIKDRVGALALDVCCDIPLWGVTAIMGPSGAGKSSLLRGISGLSRGVEGVLKFGETHWLSPHGTVPAAARNIAMVFQGNALFDHMSVLENLKFAAKWTKGGRAKAGLSPQEALTSMGVLQLKDQKAATLSGGEARRVAIARALAQQPDLLILDEPFTGLDDAIKSQLMRDLRAIIVRLGYPCLLVSHEKKDILGLSDHHLELKDGKLSQGVTKTAGFSGRYDPQTGVFTSGREAIVLPRGLSTQEGWMELRIAPENMIFHAKNHTLIGEYLSIPVTVKDQKTVILGQELSQPNIPVLTDLSGDICLSTQQFHLIPSADA
ncbi:MAG: ATP-binding cassette domain-containing protein [Halocynthiibacter sp.]